MPGWERIGKYCPKCHKVNSKKQMENEWYILSAWTSRPLKQVIVIGHQPNLVSAVDLNRSRQTVENSADKAKFTEEEREKIIRNYQRYLQSGLSRQR